MEKGYKDLPMETSIEGTMPMVNQQALASITGKMEAISKESFKMV